jgi:hypothetical protein
VQAKGKLLSIEKIRSKEPEIKGDLISMKYQVDGEEVQLAYSYDFPVSMDRQDLRLLSLIPLVNYSLFTEEIEADFPITKQDYDFIKKMMVINSREIYVNKLLKRKEFFREEYIPKTPSDEEASYSPRINIDLEQNTRSPYANDGKGSVAIMSSGGKDSLLTYGIMKEVGANVYPIFVNESGGHWKTARVAYDYFQANHQNTLRIWTTVDRFYRKMDSKIKALNDKALTMWSDTYPIRLFIFPVYIFSSLPYFLKYGISGVMKGDEFDDPRSFVPEYGINHYYGIYDQTQSFDLALNSYFESIGYGLKFYSALRSITGLVEENILFNRYPELARLQRSCHSCHEENGQIIPCGRCTKCDGILLFLTANSIDPRIINYKEQDIADFQKTYHERLFRLDRDELDHSKFLISKGEYGKFNEHVEKIHEDSEFSNLQLIDERWRDKIVGILKEYTKGFTHLENGEWT